MKFETQEPKKVDESTRVSSLFPGEDERFDTVISEVDGYHPAKGEKVVNEESQRAYFVIEGEGLIHVGEESHRVEKDDLVFVEKGQGHALEGDMKTLVITSPPFQPENERIE